MSLRLHKRTLLNYVQHAHVLQLLQRQLVQIRILDKRNLKECARPLEPFITNFLLTRYPKLFTFRSVRERGKGDGGASNEKAPSEKTNRDAGKCKEDSVECIE